MNRESFLNEILPTGFSITHSIKESGPDSLKVYAGKNNAKLKDIKLIKRIAREKVRLNGAPLKYFPIDPNSKNPNTVFDDNILKDTNSIVLGEPIDMIGTWTPQEYQMDMSKWGVMMPMGSDQQIFLHVDELSEKLGRKPLIGDIVETVRDVTRYKVTDVFYGNANLWENIFCMLTLNKATYDNYTSQLDKFDDVGENYKDTYAKLEEVLNIMDGKTQIASNEEIKQQKVKSDNPSKPKKRSLDTELDIMTMRL
jgi:hypothetical protein